MVNQKIKKRLMMLANAFVYMFVVGAGASSGVALVGIITYLLVKKFLAAEPKQKRKRGVI